MLWNSNLLPQNVKELKIILARKLKRKIIDIQNYIIPGLKWRLLIEKDVRLSQGKYRDFSFIKI